MSRIRHLTWAAVALSLLVFAPAASASYRQAIRDCATDGQLHKLYPQAQVEQALAHLPTDVAWYTNCQRVLRRALLGGDGSGNPSGGSLPATDPTLVTPSGAVAASHPDLDSLDAQLAKRGTASERIGGHTVTPGAGGIFRAGSNTAVSRPPTAIMLVLIALAAFAALGVAVAAPRFLSTLREGPRTARRIGLQTRRVALQVIRR